MRASEILQPQKLRFPALGLTRLVLPVIIYRQEDAHSWHCSPAPTLLNYWHRKILEKGNHCLELWTRW